MKKNNSLSNQPSSDSHFCNSLEYYLSLLNKLNIDFYIVGSTSLQAYCKHVIRIPNDIDICLAVKDIKKIERFCNNNIELNFIQHNVASKIIAQGKKYHLHLIPEVMTNIDKNTGKTFAKTKVFFPKEKETRALFFLSINKQVNIPVASIEVTFCLNLFSPLNSNLISSISHVINNNNFNIIKLKEVLNNVDIMQNVVISRMDKLFNIFTLIGNKRDSSKIKKILIALN